MRVLVTGLLGAVAVAGFSISAYADTTLTIATVNNGDMIRMEKLQGDFLAKNPDIKLNWVTLEENVLRQKVTTDIATKAGEYDVLTIGMYETPIRAGWTRSPIWAPPTTSTICCRRSGTASLMTASSMRRRSTARAR